MKRKREMTERMQEINREFTDNNEVLYREKLKQLQQELSAVEQGQHDIFNESIADLEEKRRETIQNAKLIMFYQISSVDHDCHLNYQLVEEESLAERSELQKAMFLILDEKRKRFKEMKDGELEPLSSGVQKRILRKRGESETPLSKLSKRKSDRSKENVGQLLNALNINDEEELEADLRAMRAHVAKSNNKMKR
ncbi:hypothetical protein K501DRAFT_18738 [Backusella circina FSU 941]|nr:hypothetical protein K501DRAFT_18738 [Backusella circina FSU 941]